MESLTIQLNEHQAASLRRVAEVQGRPEADVARDAIVRYSQQYDSPDESRESRLETPEIGAHSERPRLRTFAMSGIVEGDGSSIADVPENELLKGFGE